jgi:hypothetical protein
MSIRSRSTAVAVMALAALSLATPPAFAAFTAPLSLGTGLVLPDPSCARFGSGQDVVCAALGPDSKLTVNAYNGLSWNGWTTIGQATGSSPSCAAVSSELVLCATRATNGKLSVYSYNGAWSGPRDFGSGLASAPSCAGYRDGRAICVARSLSGGLTWTSTTGRKATAFETLAGTVTYAPGCASDKAGLGNRNVVCAYGNKDGHIYVRRFDGSTATAPVDLGGRNGREVRCTDLGPGSAAAGKVACAAVDVNSATFINTFSGGAFTLANWSGFVNANGTSSSVTSCASSTTNTLACATVAAQDSALYTIQTGGSFTLLGGSFYGDPACISYTTGKVMCVAVGIDGQARSTVGP